MAVGLGRLLPPLSSARVHYVDEGRSPVLLLLHGNPIWSFLYRHLIRELAGEFRCAAPDFPGFGLSKAPPGYDFKPASHADLLAEFVRALDLRGASCLASPTRHGTSR